jgi:hypothetical protein
MCRLHGTTFHVYAYTMNIIIVTQQSILNMHCIIKNINFLEPMKIVNILYKHCILMECQDMHVSTPWHNIHYLCLHY